MKGIFKEPYLPDGIVMEYRPLDESRDSRCGFDFIAKRSIGEDFDDDNEGIEQYEEICNGRALYDGLRHIYFTGEHGGQEGYLYYISPLEILAIMKAVNLLEKVYCDYEETDSFDIEESAK